MNNYNSAINQLSNIFRAKIISHQPIIHANTISSNAYRILTNNHQAYVLKIPFNHDRWKREVFYLTFLKDSFPVASIVELIEPTNDFSGAILMEEIPGDIIENSKLSDDIAFQMGSLLAQLHNIPVNRYQDVAQPNQIIDDPKQMLCKYFETSLNEAKNILLKDMVNQVKDCFDQYLPSHDAYDGPCIVHRDYRPGNILMIKNKITGIIDFENTLNSFTQDDFAQMEMLVWTSYPNTKEAFLNGYSSIRSLPDLSFMPLLRLSKAIGAIGFTAVRGTWNNKHQYIYDFNLNILKSILNY